MANTIIDLMGLSAEREKYLEFVPDRKINDQRYHISTNKMEELGWVPRVSWKEGIEKTGKYIITSLESSS